MSFDPKSETKFKINIVMELAESDLSKIIKLFRKNNKQITLLDFYPLLEGTIVGMTFLHSRFIAHMDIKGGNILVINQ